MVVGASEKQSIREAIEHLLARNLEIRPLFLVAARPMKVLCAEREEVRSATRPGRAMKGEKGERTW